MLNPRILSIADTAFASMCELAETNDLTLEDMRRLPAMLIRMIHEGTEGVDLKSVINLTLRETAKLEAEASPF